MVSSSNSRLHETPHDISRPLLHSTLKQSILNDLTNFQAKFSRRFGTMLILCTGATITKSLMLDRILKDHGVNSHRISVVPPLCAWRYLHKFVKLLDMNITTFPPSPPVMKNSRTWMVFTCNIMVILLLVGFATSFILTNPWFIQINLFLGLWKWNRAFLNRFHICTIDSNWVLCLGL